MPLVRKGDCYYMAIEVICSSVVVVTTAGVRFPTVPYLERGLTRDVLVAEQPVALPDRDNATHAHRHVGRFYTPALQARVHDLYRADFDAFGYDRALPGPQREPNR